MKIKGTRLRMENEDTIHHYLHVAVLNVGGNNEEERFEFKSPRERIEFRKLLIQEKPKAMKDVRILFDLF